jgi:membrane protein implicated in regulation of membrane protease activity
MVITGMPEFGMFAIGALAAALTAGLGAGIVLQVIVFAVVSVALVTVVRTAAYKRQPPAARTGIDALRGRQAIVLERVDGGADGRIKLGGEIWSARALDPGQVYEAGEQVDVVEIDGATAVVV